MGGSLSEQLRRVGLWERRCRAACFHAPPAEAGRGRTAARDTPRDDISRPLARMRRSEGTRDMRSDIVQQR